MLKRTKLLTASEFLVNKMDAYKYLQQKMFWLNIEFVNKDNLNGLNENNYQKTISNMKKGVPIIAEGVLLDYEKNTHHSPNLLVRSTHINCLFEIANFQNDIKMISKSQIDIDAPFLKWFHYRIIIFHLGKNIHEEIPLNYYKRRLEELNELLRYAQGYVPNESYVLKMGYENTT